MNALFVAVACTVLVACQAGTTTKHPHHTRDPSHTKPTHEPSEHESFSFAYDPFTHHFVMLSGMRCYVDTTLTNDQILMVHSDAGIRDLEFNLLQKLSSFTSTTKDALNTHDVKHCGHRATEFYTM